MSTGSRVVRINIDETMLPLFYGDRKGVVAESCVKGKQRLVKTKNKHRGSLTLVGVICDDPELQPVVPQFIIGNEHVLRVRDLKKVSLNLPPNVYLVRRKSGWVRFLVFAQVLVTLRKELDKVAEGIEVLLLVDASPVHTHPFVLLTAKRQRLRLIFVPASCTWLLQPCDTHAFRKFKAAVAKACNRFRVEREMTYVPMEDYIGIIVTAIRLIMQGTVWAHSFDHNGYGSEQRDVSQRVSCNLMPGIRALMPKTFPSDGDMKTMLPRNCRVNPLFLHMLATTVSWNSAARGKDGGHGAASTPSRSNDPVVPEPAVAGPCGSTQLATADDMTVPWSARLRKLPSRTCAVSSAAASSQDRPFVSHPPDFSGTIRRCPSSTTSRPHPVGSGSAILRMTSQKVRRPKALAQPRRPVRHSPS